MKKYFIGGTEQEVEMGDMVSVTFKLTPDNVDSLQEQGLIEVEDYSIPEDEPDYDEEEEGYGIHQVLDDLFELMNHVEERLDRLEKNYEILCKKMTKASKTKKE